MDYYEKKKQERYESEQNYDNWHAAQKHLLKYCPKNLTIEEVTPDFIRGFKKYLDMEATTSAGIGLSQNSKYTYYNKFKACINAAFDEGYFSS
ncbi:site-specific integrase, partial [Dysgonomonas sp. 521]|uniref:phage integrase SAM-like domain-containing protein n=1 Tax=Dysgonomonas sp. 521 TaxID=2302932 RepID=UPI00162AAACE